MNKRFEEVTRELLEKKYGSEYSLDFLSKSESPDYIGKKLNGSTVGLEICQATTDVLTLLFSGSPKVKNVKPISEIQKAGEKFVPIVAHINGVSKAYAYQGEQPNAPKQIIENAVKTMESHLKKLQKYRECDIYELAVILPFVITEDLFGNYCNAIIYELSKIKGTEYTRHFHVVHFVGGFENLIYSFGQASLFNK